MQRAMSIVEPFGEDRADTRAKLNTLAQALSETEEFTSIYNMLDNYTGDETPDPDQLEVNAAALEKVKQKNGG